MIGVIIGALAFIGGATGMIPPMTRHFEQFLNSKFPNAIPDMYTLAEMTQKDIMDGKDYFTYAEQNGFHSGLAQLFLQNTKAHMSAMDCVNAWRRGIINEDALDRRLKLLKFDPVDINLVKQLSLYFPTPSDLVTFAVREVYTPQTVSKFGQMEDIPEAFLRECAKAGLPEDQAKNYWAAHWILPSVTQAFEMYHRRVIDQSTLEMLLKSQDIMPFWREKLTEISYNPLTRVDVRRMYGLGVLDEQDVYNSYLDIGYSPENAKRMTEFTVKYENDEVNGLTRASLINSYKDNLITKEELTEYLRLFRYTDDVIEYWLDQADYEKTLEDIKLYTKDLTEQYQMGAIDIDGMRSYLLNADLPAKYIDSVIQKAILSKAPKIKIPERETLIRWLEENLIDEVYFVAQMRGLGYRDFDIQLYLTEIAERIDTTKRKYLNVAVYQRWLANKIISEDRFISIMLEMKVSQEDINTMIAEIKEAELESSETT